MFLHLYADCFRHAARGLRKSPWTLALPMIYVAITLAAGIVAAPLGIIGGFLVGIVADLCTSSFLYFTAQTVSNSTARVGELKRSFVEYFWPVVSFGFVVWIVWLVLQFALAETPQGPTILLAVSLCAAVPLNAVPEVIYQKGHIGGLAIISESVAFIQRHWIEWFIPNLLLGGALWVTLRALVRLPFGIFVVPFVGGAMLYFIAAFRGNLFHILETTSPFQLRNRYRTR